MSTIERPALERLLGLLVSIEQSAAIEFVEFARSGSVCWRGMTLPLQADAPRTGVEETRADRRPLTMPTDLSRACDDWFEDRFEWRSRSNHSLFVSGSREQAAQFGTPVVVIPLAPARFVWSSIIADLTRHIEALGIERPEDVAAVLEAGDYRDSDLAGAIASGNEIMVRCERYCWAREPS